MKQYRITERVLKLAEDLIDQGYAGTIEVTRSYPSGAGEVLDGCTSLQLHGFCKESLFICESAEGNLVFVGRYDKRFEGPEGDAGDIVRLAWHSYQAYRPRGYGLPSEFVEPFVSHGWIKKQTRTVEEYVEST